MLHKVLFASIVLTSLSAVADVDYSRCNFAAGFYGMGIDNEGQLQLGIGQKINSKTTEGNTEKYVIETDPSMFGGFENPNIGSKLEVSLVKDEQGRVVKVISGGDRLDKKAIENRKKFQIQMQVHTTVSQADFNNGNYQLGAFGTAPFKGTMTSEPTYFVTDENGNPSYLKLSQLNQNQRQKIGMSEDIHKALKQKLKRDKKTVAKIEKGLKELSDKSFPVYYLGQETEFDIKDGMCTPSKVSSRMFHTQDKSVHLSPTFTKESCEEVAKLYLKHKEKLSKCDEANNEISQDMFKNLDKIRHVQIGGGIVGGIGSGSGIGSGYPGAYLGGFNSQSPLGLMKSQCDMMLGEISFSVSPKKESSANHQ